MKILYLGDVVGKPGLLAIKNNIKFLREKYSPNLIIINGENITNGKGLSFSDYKEVMKLNIPIITMGNHTFGHKELETYIDHSNVIRPLNMVTNVGTGYKSIAFNNKKITIISLIGQIDMKTKEKLENPFKMVDELLKDINSDYIIVDMHAEATSEKEAMGFFLDGRVNAVLGTHTHVQTADERVLPKGTLYISDLGMCGSFNSILGVKNEIIINRFLEIDKQKKFEVEENGPLQINGALLDLDKKKIERVREIFK